MPDAPHVPPPSASHHGRKIRTAILQEAAGSIGADDLIYVINAALGAVYAEGFAAGSVSATDAHHAAMQFVEDKKSTNP